MPRIICVWPCGTWCNQEDIEHYHWMSDDYRLVTVGQCTTDEAIEVIISYLI